jgi:hypothetical protein
MFEIGIQEVRHDAQDAELRRTSDPLPRPGQSVDARTPPAPIDSNTSWSAGPVKPSPDTTANRFGTTLDGTHPSIRRKSIHG